MFNIFIVFIIIMWTALPNNKRIERKVLILEADDNFWSLVTGAKIRACQEYNIIISLFLYVPQSFPTSLLSFITSWDVVIFNVVWTFRSLNVMLSINLRRVVKITDIVRTPMFVLVMLLLRHFSRFILQPSGVTIEEKRQISEMIVVVTYSD